MLNVNNIPDYTGAGVYAIIDPNGKAYIGSSINIHDRILQHIANPIWLPPIFQDDLFDVKILEQCKFPITTIELRTKESIWLAKYGGVEQTYNRAKISNNIPVDIFLQLKPFNLIPGVIAIYNTDKDRYYYMMSEDAALAFQQNIIMLNRNQHTNTELQKDWDDGCTFIYTIFNIVADKLDRFILFQKMLAFDRKSYNGTPKSGIKCVYKPTYRPRLNDMILQLLFDGTISLDKFIQVLGVAEYEIKGLSKNQKFLTDTQIHHLCEYLNLSDDYFDVARDIIDGVHTDTNVYTIMRKQFNLPTHNISVLPEIQRIVAHQTVTYTIKVPIFHIDGIYGGMLHKKDIKGYFEVDINSDTPTGYEYIGLICPDNSMSPLILENDLVLIRLQDEVESGDLAVVIVDEEDGVIKRVQFGMNKITLISENSEKYPPRVFTGKESSHIRIWGKAIDLKRKLV